MMKDTSRKEWKVRIPSWVVQSRAEMMRNIPIKFSRSEDAFSGDIIYKVEPQQDFEKWLREEQKKREQRRPGRVFDL